MGGSNMGGKILNDGTANFSVWAPFAKEVQVVIKDSDEKIVLKKNSEGYWKGTAANLKENTCYKFSIDEESFPDPASRSQESGVHSWSRLTNMDHFEWNDNSWKGIPLSEMIIYELHVGTFSEKGTFEGIAEKLDHLLELGINTIEIMPVAQFPGGRNWGYDGVYPYAAQNTYGGPEGLKKLVNICHQKGFAVVLDVVYNHLGPEGNYLSQFGPYFTEKYKTPWGSALNFDDEYSDSVRAFFIENAGMWLRDFHLDGLRLDAIHEIIDSGAVHFLKALSLEIDELEKATGREYVLIAESDLNDVKIVDTYERGGFGIEAQWVDDFHHSLHSLLTGEKNGYYADFGKITAFEKSFKQAFIYDGIYSKFRKRTIGNSPRGIPKEKFVVCIQNHDQVGNRMLGDRLSTLVSFEKLKLAAGLLLVSPFTPMLFMGEEFAEDNPFQYFVSHGDKELVKAVQEGRKREFKYFNHYDGEFPDPQAEATFQRSKLNWKFEKENSKKIIFEYYKELIRLRKNGAFSSYRKGGILTETFAENQLLSIASEENENAIFSLINFGSEPQNFDLPEKFINSELILNSAAMKWQGPEDLEADAQIKTVQISPESIKVFQKK